MFHPSDIRDDSSMFDEADYRDDGYEDWDDVQFLESLNDIDLPELDLDDDFDSWDDIPE